MLGISPETLLHWEKGQTAPDVVLYPRILAFLGYDPFPAPQSLPERLLAKRRAMGWTIKEAAQELGVDEGTWIAWECGTTAPRG